jgi:hypothetical protein
MSESHSFPFIQTDLRIYWIKIFQILDPKGSEDGK